MKAFPLIEVLIAVAVLAAVATIGLMAMNGASEGSKRAKFESDIATLNGAGQMYFASSGDLSGAATSNDALAKMNNGGKG
jgi:prepilin-type N-terminal cleavage/methylation domain-containing protein